MQHALSTIASNVLVIVAFGVAIRLGLRAVWRTTCGRGDERNRAGRGYASSIGPSAWVSRDGPGFFAGRCPAHPASRNETDPQWKYGELCHVTGPTPRAPTRVVAVRPLPRTGTRAA
jgi:hypothetical protein